MLAHAGNRTVNDRIIELWYRNLQEVFGEGDTSAAAPPLRTSILKTACYTSRTVSLLDTTLWTSSPVTSARHIPTSSIRLMESHKPCTMEGFWHGAQARKARPLTTPDWMSSLFAMARSLRSTSFSIPNLLSGPRHPCGLPSRLKGVPNFRRDALLPLQFRQEGLFRGLITISRRQGIVFKQRGITLG